MSLNDYLKQLTEFIQEVRFVLYASGAKEGFSEHTVLSWDALIGSCMKSFWKLYWWGDALKRVLLNEGCENVWCLNQFVERSSETADSGFDSRR
jgi:hypothetical protein